MYVINREKKRGNEMENNLSKIKEMIFKTDKLIASHGLYNHNLN
jgi:hypothetical protein